MSYKDTVPAAPERRTFVALLLMSFLVSVDSIIFISATPTMQIAEVLFDKKKN